MDSEKMTDFFSNFCFLDEQMKQCMVDLSQSKAFLICTPNHSMINARDVIESMGLVFASLSLIKNNSDINYFKPAFESLVCQVMLLVYPGVEHPDVLNRLREALPGGEITRH